MRILCLEHGGINNDLSEKVLILHKDGNMQLKGLSWVLVRCMEEFQELYSISVQRRKVAHTRLNDVSSRRHAVFSLRVSSTDVVKGKLNLIDLAGSEDNRRTSNEGIRL